MSITGGRADLFGEACLSPVMFARIIAGLTAVLAVLLTACVFLVSPGGARLMRKGLIPARPAVELPPLGEERKRPLAFYTGVLSRGGVFSLQQMRAETDESAAAPVLLDSGIAASLAELQLQGVISGARGLQAIIVNTRTEQSFDCQGGESLAGFTVQAVQADRVILERDGKRYELRL